MQYDQIYRNLLNNRKRPQAGYSVAIVTTVLSLLLRWLLDTAMPPGFPFITFLPAVALVGFIYGPGPGALCAVLSGLAAWYFFIPPFQSFGFSFATLLTLVLYALLSGTILLLFSIADRAFVKLQQQEDAANGLAEQRRVLFQELQHRIANNLQFVASFLSIQKRKVTRDASTAIAVLDEARQRLELISNVHRRLYDPANIGLMLDVHLGQLCDDAIRAAGATKVTCAVRAEQIPIEADRAITLCLLVIEIVTNAIKHAFSPSKEGRIDISLERANDEHAVLIVRDNGKGFPEDFDPETSKSLGFRILHGFVSQLRGTFAYEALPKGEAGTIARLTFPIKETTPA